MTDVNEELMNQIAAMYEAWAAGTLNTDYGARLTNELFNIAKDLDPARMNKAWLAGSRAMLKSIRR